MRDRRRRTGGGQEDRRTGGQEEDRRRTGGGQEEDRRRRTGGQEEEDEGRAVLRTGWCSEEGAQLASQDLEQGSAGGVQKEVSSVERVQRERGRCVYSPGLNIRAKHRMIAFARAGHDGAGQRRLFLVRIRLEEGKVGAQHREKQLAQLGIVENGFGRGSVIGQLLDERSVRQVMNGRPTQSHLRRSASRHHQQTRQPTLLTAEPARQTECNQRAKAVPEQHKRTIQQRQDGFSQRRNQLLHVEKGTLLKALFATR